MYNDHFGFRCTPFDDRADTRFQFTTPDLEEVLAGLEYQVRYGRGVGLVLGDAGVGKTQTLRALLLRLHSTDHAIVIAAPAGGEFDPIREACKGFGVSLPSSGGPISRRMARLRRHLSRNAQAGHRSILILDQAEHLGASALAQVATLTEMQDERGRLLCVLVFGQPRLLALLNEAEFARLRQQFTGERYLHPFDEGRTAEYIRHRLHVAGATDPGLIDADAIRLIFAASGGVPRLINHFASEALLTAYARGADRVTAETVEEVIGATEAKTRTARLDDLALPAPTIGSVAGVSAQAIPRRFREEIREAVHQERPSRPPPVMSDYTAPAVAAQFGAPTAFEGPGIAIADTAPAALANSLETLFSQGRDLLERLERVLAKTECTCSVSEASLTQYAAVEKHLSTLSSGAERVLRSLAETVQKAQAVAQETPRQLDQAISLADGRLAQVDGKVAAITRIEERFGERWQRIEALERQIAEVEGRLQQGLQDVETKIESAARQSDRLDEQLLAASQVQPKVQRQIADLIQHMTQAETRTESMDERRSRASEIAGELRTQLQTLDTKAHAVVEAAGRELEGMVLAARDRVETQLKELRRSQDVIPRVEESLASLAENVTSRCREQFQTLQRSATDGTRTTLEALSKKQSELSDLLRETDLAAKTLQSRGDAVLAVFDKKAESEVGRTVTQCRERLQEQAVTLQRLHEEKLAAGFAEHRAQVERFLADAESRSAELSQSVTESERRQSSVHARLAPLAAEVKQAVDALDRVHQRTETLNRTVERLDDRVASAQSAAAEESAKVESLTSQATGVSARLAVSVEQAKANLQATEAATERVNALEVRAHDSVQAVAASVERIDGVKPQVANWEQTAARIERNVAIGQTCAADLGVAVESATETRRALQAMTTEAAERVGQLDSHNASAGRTRNELAEANVAAHAVLQRIESERRAVETLVREAGAVTQRFDTLHDSGRQLAERLTQLAESADATHRRAERAVAEGDARWKALDAGCKSADGVLQRIGACTDAVESITQRAETITRQAESAATATAATVDRLIHEARSLNAKSEQAAMKLHASNAHAAEWVGKLAQAVEPADAAAQRLATRMDEAERNYERITRDAQEAHQLAERVASVTHVLAGAKDAEASIQQTAADVTALQDRFAMLVTQAAQQSVSLRDLLASVETMTAEQTRARSDAENVLRRLDDHRTTTQAATQAGEELLRGFVAQSESLETRLTALTAKLVEAESEVRRALTHRDETAVQAKAQTAQLERVGDAVRKVFSAVSQAALDARDRAKELTEINRDSAQKVAVFTAETQRVTDTLHEWIREAIRAQERLERTLTAVPAIQQTHPREAMLGVHRPVPSLSGMSDSAPFGELRTVTPLDKRGSTPDARGSTRERRETTPEVRGATPHRREQTSPSQEPALTGSGSTPSTHEPAQPRHEPAQRTHERAPVTTSVQRVTPLTRRAEEIAKLIEDAKRATVDAK